MLCQRNLILCVSAQSFKEFSQLLNTMEEERRRLVRMQFLCIFFFLSVSFWTKKKGKKRTQSLPCCNRITILAEIGLCCHICIYLEQCHPVKRIESAAFWPFFPPTKANRAGFCVNTAGTLISSGRAEVLFGNTMRLELPQNSRLCYKVTVLDAKRKIWWCTVNLKVEYLVLV